MRPEISRLVRLAISRDEDAFSDLIRVYQDVIEAKVRSLYPNAHYHTRNDIFQVVRTKIWRSLPGFEFYGETSLVCWIRKVTHSVLCDHVKKKLKDNQIQLTPMETESHHRADSTSGVPTKCNQLELNDRLDESIPQLSEDLQDIVKLYRAGTARSDLHKALGIPPSTADDRLKRAVQELRKILARTSRANVP